MRAAGGPRGGGGGAGGGGGGGRGGGGGGPGGGGGGVPEVDGWYWVAMLVAGTLGTVLGDCASDGLGLGTGVATLCCGAGVAAVFVGRRWLRGAAGYWLPVVAIRTAGTTLGDFWVDGLALGLPVATACSGVAFVLAVVAGRAWATLGAGGGRGGFAGRPAGPGGASVP